MYTMVDVKQYRENSDGTDLVVSVPGMKLGGLLQRKKIKNAEIRFDDGRHISAEQRKKAYATIRDIADWTGYPPEEMKERMIVKLCTHFRKNTTDLLTIYDNIIRPFDQSLCSRHPVHCICHCHRCHEGQHGCMVRIDVRFEHECHINSRSRKGIP